MSFKDITRKDMKAPDRFQQAATRAARFVAARRKHFLLVGAAAAAIAIAFGIAVAVGSAREERAGKASAELLATISGEISSVPLPGLPGPFFPSDEARQRAVVDGATKILADHPRANAARIAALALGDAHLRLHEWDLAKEAYERFLASAPGDSLRFGALEGIAVAEEAKGNLDGAARAYDRLGREAPSFGDRADLERARILALEGKIEEAKGLLSGFADRHKESELTPDSSERLARLEER